MSFAWSPVLLGLLAVPLLAGLYVLALRRRRRSAVRLSSLALVRAAAPRRSAWRRHVPAGLLLAALAFLVVAAARPQVRVDVPTSSAALVVALDVSGSMCATDVEPNRLAAAQDAVRAFVEDQPEDTRIGLVVFAGSAQLAVAPTDDRRSLLTTIDTLTTARGTAIGAAMLKGVDAIAQINPAVAPATTSGDALDEGRVPTPGGPAAYAPEIVVLLTDGANTTGVAPLDAAQVAAERGVRVYPIGFGTTNPTSLVCSAEQLGGETFDRFRGGGGFGGGFGGRSFLVADEPTLREVAETTGGQYFSASDADQLSDVLSDLPRQVVVQARDVEVGAWLAGLAALLVVGAGWAAGRWGTFP